jgi:hypothetical protein
MALKPAQRRKIVDAIIKGVQRNGDRIFDISQDTSAGFCPVDKGTLKKSGYINYPSNGVEMGYTADYASVVEFGTEGGPIEGTQVVKVSSFRRKTKTGKVAQVSAHERRYENKRLIAFHPQGQKTIYRVINEIPPKEGQFYLTRAYQAGIAHLAEDLKYELAKLGRVR